LGYRPEEEGGGEEMFETVTAAVSALPPPLTITRYDPVLLPAVKSPDWETVPPVALQLRDGSVEDPLLQRAKAWNWAVPPGFTDVESGHKERLLRVAGTEPLIVTLAVSARPHEQDAITEKVPAICAAVNKPPTDTVPPVALYVTVTDRLTPSDQIVVDWNCWVPPPDSETAFGEMLN